MINILGQNTIIPSIRKLKYLDDALKSDSPFILLSDVHIGNLKSLTKKCHEENKKVIVHLDLVEGLTKDTKGVKILKELFEVDGVISPNQRIVNAAKKIELLSIYRLFLLDSRSFESGMKSLEKCHLDGIEMLPAPFAVHFVNAIKKAAPGVPLLAGGFIDTPETIKQVFNAGFHALTTSKSELW